LALTEFCICLNLSGAFSESLSIDLAEFLFQRSMHSGRKRKRESEEEEGGEEFRVICHGRLGVSNFISSD